MLLYFLRLEEYFSVIICTFYIIDCVQGLEFFHCNFYIIRLEKNHFGPKSMLLCTNRKWGFLQCSSTFLIFFFSSGWLHLNFRSVIATALGRPKCINEKAHKPNYLFPPFPHCSWNSDSASDHGCGYRSKRRGIESTTFKENLKTYIIYNIKDEKMIVVEKIGARSGD